MWSPHMVLPQNCPAHEACQPDEGLPVAFVYLFMGLMNMQTMAITDR